MFLAKNISSPTWLFLFSAFPDINNTADLEAGQEPEGALRVELNLRTMGSQSVQSPKTESGSNKPSL